MAYRDETDPLKTEESTLASELATLRRREREVVEALDRTRAKLRKERTLPVLEDVRIASPCSASWDEMVGADERVRFCGKCAKNVYNLSEMTRDEAERLVATNEGEMCFRLYRRADGTVLTSDCAVGVRRKRIRRVAALAVAAAGVGSAGMLTAFRATMEECPRPAQMGAVQVPRPTAPVSPDRGDQDRQAQEKASAAPAQSEGDPLQGTMMPPKKNTVRTRGRL
jgi:hypothetical protein